LIAGLCAEFQDRYNNRSDENQQTNDPQTAVSKLTAKGMSHKSVITQLSTAQLRSPILQQSAAELQGFENHDFNDQQPFLSQISWTHHMVILDKTNTQDERIFYIKEAIRNGWNQTKAPSRLYQDGANILF
jgi:hypothetical protein